MKASRRVGLVGLFALVGCTTTSKMAKPLGDFSAATSDTTTVTTSTLTIVQTVDQEAQATKAAASAPKELKEDLVKEFFRPNDLMQRQLALQALSNYAATLKALAGVDRSADIQKSFDSLKTSIDSTVTNINKLATDSKTPIPTGVISGLVGLGSNLVIAYQVQERDAAIQQALERSDPTISHICHLLAWELRQPIYDQLKHDYRTEEEAANDAFQALIAPKTEGESPPKDSTKARTLPKPPDLVPPIKSFATLNVKKEYSLELISSLALAYQRIAEAHAALKLESKTGVKSAGQLRALSSQIDNVKVLYAQIPK